MTIFIQMKREFSAFFFSPIAYVILGVSALLNGALFLLIINFLSGPQPTPGAPLEMMFSWILFWIVVIVVTPLITMRTLAEEKHSGTLETLVTAPISDTQVVISKFLASFVIYLVLWVPTAVYPFLLSKYSQIDLGPILAGYVGTAGVGAMFVAVGILCSALTRNQIIASFITVAVLMALFLLGLFEYVDGIPFARVFKYTNLLEHMTNFSKGIVDTRPLIYYGSVCAGALFFAVQVLQSRRWR